MTAKILTFPTRTQRYEQPSLGDLLVRQLDPSLNYFEREQITTCIAAYRAAGHFLTLGDDTTARDNTIAAGIQSLEKALFHALSMQGCPNQSRDLYQLLASRQAKREEPQP